ncbi:hypothetical protein IAD21_01450 [Abditibacteriota bacterium]|nr:hypothetical protein IAD21_01450 [Abditibacteriota bacterium]
MTRTPHCRCLPLVGKTNKFVKTTLPEEKELFGSLLALFPPRFVTALTLACTLSPVFIRLLLPTTGKPKI